MAEQKVGVQVEVTVEYLPAKQPFHEVYPEDTVVEKIRTQAMGFFGVSDHQDRDTHRFFLEFDRQRVTNTGQTLGQLLGPHRSGAHFNLVEEITPGQQECRTYPILRSSGGS